MYSNFHKIFILLIVFNFNTSIAQTIIDCNSPRYDQEIFTSVDVQSNVVYGSNINASNANQILIMDIYQPAGDTASIRPLIVWVHGGSFIGGSKNEQDVTELSMAFARRGYVCASINYRLGIPIPFGETNATKAVYRAVQDMKAAVRFFRKDAATLNDYRIDPDLIFGGGSSAGAFTALHLAYLNEIAEIPPLIDTLVMGNIEGESGNPGYRSDINAVINLCGALGKKEYITPGDIPFVSMHGTNDQTVPYATDTIKLLGIFPIMEVDGSYSAALHAENNGVHNEMYTYYGSGHVPYLNNSAYMDTTVRFVSNFLYNYLMCSPLDPNPLPNTFGTTSIKLAKGNENAIKVYPNPAKDYLNVESSTAIREVSLVDIAGKNHSGSMSINGKHLSIDRQNLSSGFYILRVINADQDYRVKVYLD